jgi:hypothetical protein
VLGGVIASTFVDGPFRPFALIITKIAIKSKQLMQLLAAVFRLKITPSQDDSPSNRANLQEQP